MRSLGPAGSRQQAAAAKERERLNYYYILLLFFFKMLMAGFSVPGFDEAAARCFLGWPQCFVLHGTLPRPKPTLSIVYAIIN